MQFIHSLSFVVSSMKKNYTKGCVGRGDVWIVF